MKLNFSILTYILILLAAGFTSFYFNPQLTHVYENGFPGSGGGLDINLTGVAVFIYSLEFFSLLSVLLLGDKFRYKVAGVFLGLAILDGIFNDSSHINFWPFLIVASVLSGYVLRLVASNTLGKMRAFEQYKKYF